MASINSARLPGSGAGETRNPVRTLSIAVLSRLPLVALHSTRPMGVVDVTPKKPNVFGPCDSVNDPISVLDTSKTEMSGGRLKLV